jgi:hypothetical protein
MTYYPSDDESYQHFHTIGSVCFPDLSLVLFEFYAVYHSVSSFLSRVHQLNIYRQSMMVIAFPSRPSSSSSSTRIASAQLRARTFFSIGAPSFFLLALMT